MEYKLSIAPVNIAYCFILKILRSKPYEKCNWNFILAVWNFVVTLTYRSTGVNFLRIHRYCFFFSFQKYFFFFTSSALCYSILNEVTSSFFIEFLQKKPLYCYIKLPGLDPRDKCIFYYKTRRCCRSVVFMPPKLLFPERIFNLKLVAATTFFGFSLLFNWKKKIYFWLSADCFW